MLEDEIESWLMTFDVEVPWPVIKVLGVVVEDDDNQVLDPDESSKLRIVLPMLVDWMLWICNRTIGLLNNSGSADVSVENLNPSFGFWMSVKAMTLTIFPYRSRVEQLEMSWNSHCPWMMEPRVMKTNFL